jgi:hypothetical protein
LLLSILIAGWFTASSVRAHEPGMTHVTVTFEPDGTYRVDLTTDAETLLEKLESAAGREPSSGAHEALETRLEALDETFRRRVEMMFDGSAARPSIDYSVDAPSDASTPGATIRLTGTVPKGARSFTWNYGWTFTPYAFSVREATQPVQTESGAGPAITEWLESGERSRQIGLAAPAAASSQFLAESWRTGLGFTHKISRSASNILFVLTVFLLDRGLKRLSRRRVPERGIRFASKTAWRNSN